MTKKELINEILLTMVEKGMLVQGDFNYNIYGNLLKNDSKKELEQMLNHVKHNN